MRVDMTRTAVRLALLAPLAVPPLLVVPAARAATIDTPDQPLTQVRVTSDLNCSVHHQGDWAPAAATSRRSTATCGT